MRYRSVNKPKQPTPVAPASKVPAKRLRDPRLRRWVGYGFKYVVPTGCSVLLVVWLFHKVDFHEVLAIVRREVDFWWIALMMVITMCSHIIRGFRWGLQLDAAGIRGTSKLALADSIFGTYALNLVLPRLGEAWRCIFISRRRHCSVSTVVGTVLGDRASDMVVVILLIILTLIVAGGQISDFLDHYQFGKHLTSLAENPWLYAIIAMVVGAVWSVFHFFGHYKFLDNVKGVFDRIAQGFDVLFHLPRLGLYLWYTLGIWTCYYLETYVCFFAFPFTRHMVHEAGTCFGLLPGLVTFVFGSCSMAVPSNGGLGPWNIAVMFALSLYGISEAEGTAFSLVMWSCQAFMLVLLGVWTLVNVIIYRRRHPDDVNRAVREGRAHSAVGVDDEDA